MRYLVKNLNEKFLGPQFTAHNLSTVFGKLMTIATYGLLANETAQEILEMRNQFMENVQDFYFDRQNLGGEDRLNDLLEDRYRLLQEVGTSLKLIIEKISNN